MATLVLVSVCSFYAMVCAADFSTELDPVEFWTERRTSLDPFVDDFRAYRRITSMSDGRRHWKELNGAQYESPVPIGSGRTGFEAVMARDRIDPRVYHDFRSRLVRLRLIQVESTKRYTGFIYDGMLDNLMGFVRMMPGERPPQPGERMLDGTEVVGVMPLGGQWYFVTTT